MLVALATAFFRYCLLQHTLCLPLIMLSVCRQHDKNRVVALLQAYNKALRAAGFATKKGLQVGACAEDWHPLLCL